MHRNICPSITLIAVALVLGSGSASGQEAAAAGQPDTGGYRAGTAQQVGIPLSGVELGMGWDSRRGEVVPNRCIEFAPVQARGQATRLHLTEVSDQSELMQSLSVDASVSVRTIFASGDAKSSFAKSSKVKASSTNLVLQATIDNGVLFVGPKRMPDRARFANPQFGERGEPAPEEGWRQWADDAGSSDLHSLTFRPWAKDFLDSGQAADFRRRCGDSFVAAIQSGAELLALITFTASSADEKQKIAASISADFGIVQASASVEQANNSSRESSNLGVTVSQIGGSSGPIATSRPDLVEKLKLLAADAAMAPKFHSMQVVSYDSLADWPPNLPLTTPTDQLEVIADTYWFLSSYYDLLEEIIGEPAAYSYATGLIPSELMVLQDKVLETRASLLAGLREAAAGEVRTASLLMTDGLPVPGGGAVDFGFAETGLLGAESALPKAVEWVDALAESLEDTLPFGNPNTLLLHLPLPQAATAGLLGDEAGLRALAVRHHLHDQAKRFCRLDPTDNQCLTNAKLRELEDHVTVNLNEPPDDQRLQNIGSGLCLSLPRGATAFVTADCDTVTSDQGVFVAQGTRIQLTGPAPTCLSVAGTELEFVAPCEGGTEWSFTASGKISAGEHCLQARGRDENVAVEKCATDDPPPLAQTWRPLDTDA